MLLRNHMFRFDRMPIATANLKRKKKDWKQSMTASFPFEVLKKYENYIQPSSLFIIAQCYQKF